MVNLVIRGRYSVLFRKSVLRLIKGEIEHRGRYCVLTETNNHSNSGGASVKAMHRLSRLMSATNKTVTLLAFTRPFGPWPSALSLHLIKSPLIIFPIPYIIISVKFQLEKGGMIKSKWQKNPRTLFMCYDKDNRKTEQKLIRHIYWSLRSKRRMKGQYRIMQWSAEMSGRIGDWLGLSNRSCLAV